MARSPKNSKASLGLFCRPEPSPQEAPGKQGRDLSQALLGWHLVGIQGIS